MSSSRWADYYICWNCIQSQRSFSQNYEPSIPNLKRRQIVYSPQSGRSKCLSLKTTRTIGLNRSIIISFLALLLLWFSLKNVLTMNMFSTFCVIIDGPINRFQNVKCYNTQYSNTLIDHTHWIRAPSMDTYHKAVTRLYEDSFRCRSTSVKCRRLCSVTRRWWPGNYVYSGIYRYWTYMSLVHCKI